MVTDFFTPPYSIQKHHTTFFSVVNCIASCSEWDNWKEFLTARSPTFLKVSFLSNELELRYTIKAVPKIRNLELVALWTGFKRGNSRIVEVQNVFCCLANKQSGDEIVGA